MTECRLEVSRTDLVEALRTIGKVLRRDLRQEALLEPDPEGFEISCGGITTSLVGDGAWPQRVRVPGGLLLGLARRLPPGDPVVIAVAEGLCHFGSVSLPCKTSPAETPRVELPIDETPAELLALPQFHSASVLEGPGFGPAVEGALRRRERLIARVLPILAPLGVTESDLQWVIQRTARRSLRQHCAVGRMTLLESQKYLKEKG